MRDVSPATGLLTPDLTIHLVVCLAALEIAHRQAGIAVPSIISRSPIRGRAAVVRAA